MQTYSPIRFAEALRLNAFSDGVARSHMLDAGRSLTVNLTQLTAQEQGLARAALAEWQAISGIQFRETTTAADITYRSDGSSARTTTTYREDEILSATVNISGSRVSPGDGVGSYAFRTYMHETGHALGLGHPQDYADGSDFSRSTIANDSWQLSLMSYYSQTENTVIDADHAYNLTPMLADYLAVRMAYGPVPVRAGNTVYGVGSTAGGTLDQIARTDARVAFLIADTGGTDHLSFAGDARAMRIDLRPGAISDVLGLVGNMQIATDTLIEHATGGRGNDVIIGNAGANHLNGGAGADTLAGGAGNDTYAVTIGDRVVEAPGGGYDVVRSATTHTLAASVEQLVLVGGTAANGTGNALANRIHGNAAGNVLNGGAGADTLAGQGGHDAYFVTRGDVVVEAAGAGIDIIYSATPVTLAANVENGTLTGATAVNMAGNAAGNRLIGNAAANTLFGLGGNDVLIGGGGADRLQGGTGNDTYVIDAGDHVVELAGQGFDTVRTASGGALAAGVERMVLTGFGAVNAWGNAGDNTLVGNAVANTLSGGLGNDSLRGGGGADRFVFGARVDTILDFQDDRDTIVLRSHLGAATAADALTRAQQVGADVLFDFGLHELLVANATLASLRNDVEIA